jgi:hypothetical protein
MRESLIETRSEIWRGDRCLRGKAGSQAVGRFGSPEKRGLGVTGVNLDGID